MPVEIEIALPGQARADVLALPVTGSTPELQGEAARILDEKLGGRLARLAAGGELRGDLGSALLLHLEGELRAPRLLLTGVGPRERVDAEALRTAAAVAAGQLGRVGGTLLWMLDETLPVAAAEQAAALVEGTILGDYRPGRWKTDGEVPKPIERIVIGMPEDPDLRAAIDRAALLAERTNRARDLANAPPNELTPERLADHARRLADEHEHLTAEVLGPDELESLGMGAFLAVGRASANPPRLIVLRYDPPRPSSGDVIGLVGKAVTFDSGGISLKPPKSMQDMKGDMAGGGAVLEGIAAVAALGVPVRMLAVVGAAENVMGPDAFRPGDILRAAAGRTIEIVNTDAEGRLVLADALWYARREGATHLLDLATLTGAMEVALGDLYAGLFATDDDWRDRVEDAAGRSGDLVWPFPLHRRYRRYLDSDYADLKNASELRLAGAVVAAKFLEEFAGDVPWAHIDMAGPAFLGSSRGDSMRVAGGTGWGVRLIAALAESFA
jgi:leucyl aminopeptidase